MPEETPILRGFHAHIYFDPRQIEQAQELARQANALTGCGVGRFHEKPVGPHPRGSCQLSMTKDQFAVFAPWAVTARGTLTIFAHGLSGSDLADHTHHVVWFGPSEPLDLSIFG
ncbi:MAG: 4,5-dioxygenase [Citromicrobium sp.]|nr:4,5-dioxygenase [Citromicrobium sp.]